MKNGQYTSTQRKLHWWMAALISGQYLGQDAMREAMAKVDAAQTPELTGFLITTAHSLAGFAILGVLVWRWRLRRTRSVVVANGGLSSNWALLARAWHLSLYAVTFAMVVSGMATYYTDIEFMAYAHEQGKWLLGTLVIGHMLAGLAHWLIFKDQVLQGMLGNRRDADTIRSSDQSAD